MTIIDEGHFTEIDCPFTMKPDFSTLGFIKEISRQRPLISFIPDYSIRNLLAFIATTLYEDSNLSPNPIVILSFDIIFLETDIAQGMIFKGKRSAIIQKFTMDVDPGYKCIRKFRGNFQWYMLEFIDIVSRFCIKLKNEIGKLVFFNGQSITFRLLIKEIFFL